MKRSCLRGFAVYHSQCYGGLLPDVFTVRPGRVLRGGSALSQSQVFVYTAVMHVLKSLEGTVYPRIWPWSWRFFYIDCTCVFQTTTAKPRSDAADQLFNQDNVNTLSHRFLLWGTKVANKTNFFWQLHVGNFRENNSMCTLPMGRSPVCHMHDCD